MDRQGPERLCRTEDNNVEERINGEMNPEIENGGDDWAAAKTRFEARCAVTDGRENASCRGEE